MDIRKWLAETESPVFSQQPEVERFLLPRQPDAVPDARRERKRSASDSSLLKAPSPQRRRKGVSSHERDRYGVPDVADKGQSDASPSDPSESTASVMSQRYARKPRRKTRPDKYDIGSNKAKEQDEAQRPCRKSESRKSKRKPRQKKDDKTHNGIGQVFQARNVSKDRLTLKPSEKMGLFSKGRTSTSVKGRGLPDLVFSEMRFLRNNHSGDDHTAQALDARKKRKKDHARTKEIDISAFFTTVRPVLADTDGNTQAKSKYPTGSSAGARVDRLRQARDPSKVSDTAVPIAEPESKASYLGSGSRGPRHESSSHFSWSDSVRAPSITPGRPKNTSIVHEKRGDAWNRETAEVSHGRGTASHQEVPSSITRNLVNAPPKQFRVSSVAPMPSQLPDSGEMLKRYGGTSQAERRHTPSRKSRCAEAQPSPRPFDTGRQSRHVLYQRAAQAPAVRFVGAHANSSRLPNISGPSIYVQQEQRQRLPVHLGLEDYSDCRDPDCYGQEYISRMLDPEEFEDLSGEPVPYGLMEGIDDDVEGLDHVADDVEQVREPERTSVVAPGFWRPNRLY